MKLFFQWTLIIIWCVSALVCVGSIVYFPWSDSDFFGKLAFSSFVVWFVSWVIIYVVDE